MKHINRTEPFPHSFGARSSYPPSHFRHLLESLGWHFWQLSTLQLPSVKYTLTYNWLKTDWYSENLARFFQVFFKYYSHLQVALNVASLSRPAVILECNSFLPLPVYFGQINDDDDDDDDHDPWDRPFNHKFTSAKIQDGRRLHFDISHIWR